MKRALVAGCSVAAVLLLALLAFEVVRGSHSGVHRPVVGPAAPLPEPIPLPPAGALTLAAQSGRKAVTIAVRPAGTRTEATVGVIGPDGLGANGLPVRVDGAGAAACGKGCYRALVPGRPAAIRVDAGTGIIVFPLHTVPGPAAALVARAGRLLRAATSVVYRDRLSSGPGHTLETLWKEQAPDRLSYVIAGGIAGIVIGDRRWDRETRAGPWVASPQQPLNLPALPWTRRITNFHILDADGAGWTVSFLDRSMPAWFRARIDRRTGRLVSFRMIAASHFMHDEYVANGGKVEIRPPR